MELEKGVPFDPGYSEHTYHFSENIESVYNVMASIKAPHQKKFQFKVFVPRIAEIFGNSVAFYLGCLLWASYINKNFAQNPKEILNNNFYAQETDDEYIFSEVDFMLEYISKFEKDTKYYLGKPEKFPQNWERILTVYKSFLFLNSNFKDVKMTSDLKLPSEIKEISKENLEIILKKIESVTESGRLEELFDVEGLLI